MMLSAELKHRINYEISMLEKAKKEYNMRLDRLSGYKSSVLKQSVHGKNRYFYVKKQGSAKPRYLGTSCNHEVQRIREARFLEEAIRRIDQDISLLNSLLEGFLPFDPSSISDSLPEVYRCKVPPVSERYEYESKKWLKRRLEFQKRFPENYPENKTQRTSDNVMVKTISELVMYERFKSAGLAQIYELPFLPADHGPALYPDCTILSPVDMKTEIIVEYVGRFDLSDYRGDFARKVGRYIKSGYIPGVNLFFIFSDNDGNVDSTQITKVIMDILGIVPETA